MVDGHPRQVWIDGSGDQVIESYSITHMAHGAPLATGEADDECGAAGPFLLEVGISSSYHIAKFFGLTVAGLRHVASRSETVTIVPEQPRGSRPAAAPARAHGLQEEVLEGEVLDKEFKREPGQTHVPPSSHLNISAVITKALKAAGLMKV